MKTKQEKSEEIMQLSMSGMSARQIAIKLSYSASTVNRYLREWREAKTYDMSFFSPIAVDEETFLYMLAESTEQNIDRNVLISTAIKMYCQIVHAYRQTGNVAVNLAPFLPKP